MSTKNKKKKIGLALSGGAARGLAHIGVLDVLQREGIPIDLVTGTSAGAIIGAIYASCRDCNIVKKIATNIDWKKLSPFIDLTLPKSGFIKGKKIENLIASFLGIRTDFADLKIPFACVATDIDTGEEIIFNRGSVPTAVRASISVPGVFTAVRWDERFLVDGGLTTPVPVELVREMGADFIIAVNVNPPVSKRMGKSSKLRAQAHKEPNLFQVITQLIAITTYAVVQNNMVTADIIIEPKVAHIGPTDFQKVGEMILMGQEAAIDAIPKIKRKLAAL
ncbi:MAG: patatin-like phospholipase family protein [Dehalococcoidales bacterium]